MAKKTITEFCCECDRFLQAGEPFQLEVFRYAYFQEYGRSHSLIELRFMDEHVDSHLAELDSQFRAILNRPFTDQDFLDFLNEAFP